MNSVGMAELVDARVSKTRDGNIMPVRFRLPAPIFLFKMNNNCVFCKIVSKELPASIIKETNDLIIIKDINPKAKIHYLIITKKHFTDLNSINDPILLNKVISMPTILSEELSIPSYRLVVNNGKDAGQIVFHFHIHFLSGKLI